MSDTKQHGGKRNNSGRPQLEPTKVMRVPVALEDVIKEIIDTHNQKNSQLSPIGKS